MQNLSEADGSDAMDTGEKWGLRAWVHQRCLLNQYTGMPYGT